MRLTDKIIIITGSTAGIGNAIARQCVAEGAKVVLHGLEREEGGKTLADLGDSAALVLNDLTRPESVDELVSAALGRFGRIDAIVNNAATVRRARIEETDAAMFDSVIALNLRAPLLLIRAALPHLLKSRGSVLNIGSVNAYCGSENLLPYSVSKGGLMTLTRNLADRFAGQGVRFNQLNLGWVLTENEKRTIRGELERANPPGTPGWRDWFATWWENQDWLKNTGSAPTGRLMTPEEIAIATVYWIGDESRPVTGSVLELNQFPIIGRNSVKER